MLRNFFKGGLQVMAVSTIKHSKESIFEFIQGSFGGGTPIVKSRAYELVIDGQCNKEKIIVSDLPEKNLRIIFDEVNQNLYERFGRFLEVRGNYIFVTQEV